MGTTPSNSDTSQRQGHRFALERGPGMRITFRCARCDQARDGAGRKLLRVQGVKQYVCKGCQ